MILAPEQRLALINEIEANYIHTPEEIFTRAKQDLRMNLFSYEHPMLSGTIANREIRIAHGFTRDKKRTYLGYVDGLVVSEAMSKDECLNDLKTYIQ